ncbi:hypothetical protein TNCV_2867581 [Trichonephila clavipes]|nr:hypothetical protein TNCV_2867581 [Trichonephila clavipes]
MQGHFNEYSSTYANSELGDFQIQPTRLGLFYPPPLTETQAELVLESDEIGNLIIKKLSIYRRNNLEVDNDDVQELLDSHNQELTIDEPS